MKRLTMRWMPRSSAFNVEVITCRLEQAHAAHRSLPLILDALGDFLTPSPPTKRFK